MDPLSLAFTGVVAAGSLATGYAWARRSAPRRAFLEPDETSVAALQAELSAVRRLAGLSGIRSALRASALGEARDVLESQLAELYSSKALKVAAFFDGEGLPVAGASDEGATVLGAWVSRAARLGASATATVELRRPNGDILRADRLVPTGRKQPLWAGTWSVGRPLAETTVARLRYALEGSVAVDPPTAVTSPWVAAPKAAGGAASDVIARISTTVAVQGISVFSESQPIVERGFKVEASALEQLTSAGGFDHGLMQAGDTLALGSADEGTICVHRFDRAEDQHFALVLLLPANVRVPWSRLHGWAAQFAWDLHQDFDADESIREGA